MTDISPLNSLLSDSSFLRLASTATMWRHQTPDPRACNNKHATNNERPPSLQQQTRNKQHAQGDSHWHTPAAASILTFSCRAFSAAAAAIAACFDADRATVKDHDGTGGACACRCASAECGGVAPAAAAAAFFCASAAAAAARALMADEEEEEEDRNYYEDSIRLVLF